MAVLTYCVHGDSLKDNQTLVNARGFQLIIDEPESAGGDNMGATPVEYLLGALSGCMNILCNKVAKEMDIKINSLSFDIEGDIDTKKFMGKAYTHRAGFMEIRVYVKADVSCDANKKEIWLKEVKARCPVSDNITNETPVKVIVY